MFPVIIIAGATCTGKTSLAVSIAKTTNSILFPLDQLQRYKYLSAGVGYDNDIISQVNNYGYHIISPWEISGPDKYVLWLKESIEKYSDNYPVIIEGGCTSYLLKILELRETDKALKAIKIFALDIPQNALSVIKNTYPLQKIKNIIMETDNLINLGFISKKNTSLFEKCEHLFKHPEYDDNNLAWAIRISSKVYYPAFLALTNQITLEQAQIRIINSVSEIQKYQNTRVHNSLELSNIIQEQYYTVFEKELVHILSENKL